MISEKLKAEATRLRRTLSSPQANRHPTEARLSDQLRACTLSMSQAASLTQQVRVHVMTDTLDLPDLDAPDLVGEAAITHSSPVWARGGGSHPGGAVLGGTRAPGRLLHDVCHGASEVLRVQPSPLTRSLESDFDHEEGGGGSARPPPDVRQGRPSLKKQPTPLRAPEPPREASYITQKLWEITASYHDLTRRMETVERMLGVPASSAEAGTRPAPTHASGGADSAPGVSLPCGSRCGMMPRSPRGGGIGASPDLPSDTMGDILGLERDEVGSEEGDDEFEEEVAFDIGAPEGHAQATTSEDVPSEGAAAGASSLDQTLFAITSCLERQQDDVRSLHARIDQLTAALSHMAGANPSPLPHPTSIPIPPPLPTPSPPPASLPTAVPPPVPRACEDSDPFAIQLETARLNQRTQEERAQVQLWNRKMQQLKWCGDLVHVPHRGRTVMRTLATGYGLVLHPHAGTPDCLEALAMMYRSFGGGEVVGHDVVRFAITSGILPGILAAYFGRDGVLSTCLEDFWCTQLPPNTTYTLVDGTTFANPPAPRKKFTSLLEVFAAGRAAAYVIGAFYGARLRFELELTLTNIKNFAEVRGSILMTPGWATRLLNRLLSAFFDAVATPSAPGHFTPCPIPPAYHARYLAEGWTQEGPGLHITMTGEFAEIHYHQAYHQQQAEMVHELAKMRTRGAPRLGPSGGAPAPVVGLRLSVGAYTDAEKDLIKHYDQVFKAGKPGGPSLCIRSLTFNGCPTGHKCNFRHIEPPVEPSILHQAYATCPLYRRVADTLGGPPAVANRTGGVPTPVDPSYAVNFEDESDDDDCFPSGGPCSGSVPCQVPYLTMVRSFYPRAPSNDARSATPTLTVQRPPTIHPDGPVSTYGGRGDLARITAPDLQKVGGCVMEVSVPDAAGRFLCTVGPVRFRGLELGQTMDVLTTSGLVSMNLVCVFLTCSHLFGLEPAELYLSTAAAAYAACSELGPPSDGESSVSVFMRTLAHDLGTSPSHPHPVDALALFYLPPPALDSRVWAVLHYHGSALALDIIHGKDAKPDASWVFCLQQRGSPGHMQPLALDGSTPAAFLTWARLVQIPIREFTATGWRSMAALSSGGRPLRWADHAVCDCCGAARDPLPPCPV